MLFEEMLRSSSYKYSSSINGKGKENSSESLFIILFDILFVYKSQLEIDITVRIYVVYTETI